MTEHFPAAYSVYKRNPTGKLELFQSAENR